MRFPTLSLSLLAVAPFARAQITPAPRAELALLVDNGLGVVHRLDAKTGRYFGAMGGGLLTHPFAIACRPGSSLAYVGDEEGIKLFNVSSGAYVGLIHPVSPATKVGVAYDLRFSPDGRLYALMFKAGESRYFGDLASKTVSVQRIDPNTGAIVEESALLALASNAVAPSLTINADGTVEVWDAATFTTYQGNGLALQGGGLLTGPGSNPSSVLGYLRGPQGTFLDSTNAQVNPSNGLLTRGFEIVNAGPAYVQTSAVGPLANSVGNRVWAYTIPNLPSTQPAHLVLFDMSGPLPRYVSRTNVAPFAASGLYLDRTLPAASQLGRMAFYTR